MQTLLITGSNGLLGQKLIDKLAQRSDIRLIASSKGENRHPETSGYDYVSLDITVEAEVQSVFQTYQPTAVINTAAMTNVDACETAREACVALNVKAVEYLLKACEQSGAYLVHLSTDFIFDGEEGPYKETDTPRPLSFYGQSKWDSEQVLMNAGYSNWSILRTIIVYGLAANMSRSNIILWAKQALEKGDSIHVVDDQFRSPTLAEDLADACILAVEKQAKGVFHTSGKDFMSILELVYRVADFFGLDRTLIKPAKSSGLNQPAKRPPRTGFILDKAMRELNYQPHSFEEGLAIVKEQLKHTK